MTPIATREIELMATRCPPTSIAPLLTASR